MLAIFIMCRDGIADLLRIYEVWGLIQVWAKSIRKPEVVGDALLVGAFEVFRCHGIRRMVGSKRMDRLSDFKRKPG